MKIIKYVVIVVVFILLMILLVGKQDKTGGYKPPSLAITNFEECASAGNPIMESYPRQCRYNEQTFIENIIPVTKGGCYVGGCSAQICSDEKDVASDCMYRPEYACYQSATCERQTSGINKGQCGWTETSAFLQCMSAVSSTDNTRVAAGYIAGHIDIGPNCPVEQIGKPCPPSPEAYSSREVIVYDNDGITINEKGKIDVSGNFKIAIGPGSYFVQINPAGIGAGEKKPVTVKSSQTATINFDIDTGIR